MGDFLEVPDATTFRGPLGDVQGKYFEFFLEYTILKDDLTECKCLSCNKSYQQKLDKKLKERFLNTYKFSSHYNNTCFYCCKKVLILMKAWMIDKNSMKQLYLKNKVFIVTEVWKILLMQIMRTQKEFVKILK